MSYDQRDSIPIPTPTPRPYSTPNPDLNIDFDSSALAKTWAYEVVSGWNTIPQPITEGMQATVVALIFFSGIVIVFRRMQRLTRANNG